MKFQAATGHAIMILGCLGKNDGKLATAGDMAQELGISYLYFMKICRFLKQGGLILSEQGCNGGYRLARDIDEISVYDAVCAVEGEICIDKGIQSTGMKEDRTMLHLFFKDVQDIMIKRMRETRISELYDEKKEAVCMRAM